jgi:type II secretory ATPase GspE/PulE/Tfp pilus assembly ATPase PilB-like protein
MIQPVKGQDVASVLAVLPRKASLDDLRTAGVCPLRVDDHRFLVVALARPDAYPEAQLLARSMKLATLPEPLDPVEMEAAFRALYDARSAAPDEAADSVEGVDDLDRVAREEVLSDSVDAPVIRLINGLLSEAVKSRVTDIHLEPFEDCVLVRFRVDGALHERLRLDKNRQAPLVSRLKVMARMDIAERFSSQDGRIGITIGGKSVDIRVGVVPTRHGERVALRILDRHTGLLTMEGLGMLEEDRRQLETLVTQPNGLVLLTGPTGSGKTTSLYAILQKVARPDINVITVEDPVEYDVPGISQIQVNEKAGITFASALRSILRQDPDVVMVGEMRDLETAHMGVQASLTGHLVLSTLHTNDAPSAVVRLADMGVEPYLVGSSLLGVVAQRLVRRVCPHCARQVPAPEALQKRGITVVFEPNGCEHCQQTGYRGRLGLYEFLRITPSLRSIISRGGTAEELVREARKTGYRTLMESGLARLALGNPEAGTTTVDELCRVAGTTEGVA